MSAFLLSCLAYLSVALPGSTLGMLWPSMRISIHEPVGALGIMLMAGALAMESAAPALWLIAVGSAVFSAGFFLLTLPAQHAHIAPPLSATSSLQ